MPFVAKTKSLQYLAASLIIIMLAACSKHDNAPVINPPSDFTYTPAVGVTLKGSADTSVTPFISWNGKKGDFSFASAVPEGVTINSATGKISWPSNLAIGSYKIPVIAKNGSAVSDTINYDITISGPITTIAGLGAPGFSGDGGPAVNAQLNTPWDLTADGAGNLYVADAFNNRIRIIRPDGSINTFAGNGEFEFSGDNGPATLAAVNRPTGITADSAGQLYITEMGNSRIRKIQKDGTISTIAGSAYSSLPTFYGDEGPATSARLYLLAGKVTLGSDGSVFIADYGNQRVRKVTPDGIIHTIAGTGQAGAPIPDGTPAQNAQLISPTSVYFDPAKQDLYIVSHFSVIYRLNGGSIYNEAGSNPAWNSEEYTGDGGPASQSYLQRLSNIAVDKSGNIFFNDMNADRIYRISPDGILSTIAGNGKYGFSGDGGPAAAAMLAHPYGLAVDANGDLYIADTDNNRIRKVTLH